MYIIKLSYKIQLNFYVRQLIQSKYKIVLSLAKEKKKDKKEWTNIFPILCMRYATVVLKFSIYIYSNNETSTTIMYEKLSI